MLGDFIILAGVGVVLLPLSWWLFGRIRRARAANLARLRDLLHRQGWRPQLGIPMVSLSVLDELFTPRWRPPSWSHGYSECHCVTSGGATLYFGLVNGRGSRNCVRDLIVLCTNEVRLPVPCYVSAEPLDQFDVFTNIFSMKLTVDGSTGRHDYVTFRTKPAWTEEAMVTTLEGIRHLLEAAPALFEPMPESPPPFSAGHPVLMLVGTKGMLIRGPYLPAFRLNEKPRDAEQLEQWLASASAIVRRIPDLWRGGDGGGNEPGGY